MRKDKGVVMKFKKGDTVRLLKHGTCYSPVSPAYSVSWSEVKNGLLGMYADLSRKDSITGFWIVQDHTGFWSWPEEGMELVSSKGDDDEPTMPGVKPIPASAEKPEWLVSRSATLHDNECFCGHSIPCDYHTVPATQRSPSFGEGFAMAQAIRAQFPKP